jgi:glyoxylase-like metal-dependent hydrolase (beta-lactamase superfamily II)
MERNFQMSQGIHEFKIGDIRCVAINDGEGSIMDLKGACQSFPNTDTDEVKVAFDSLSEQQKRFCFNILYVEADNQKIVIDTGFGPPAHDGIGYLVEHLQEIGISAGDIDIIMITHAHPDHINGLVDSDGNLAFPNARYVISKKEWEFWQNPEGMPTQHIESTQKKLNFIRDNFSLIEPGDEFVSGVSIVEAYGHTSGHINVMIESNDKRLLYIVDIAHNQIEAMHPDWDFMFDMQHNKANATRRRIMQRAVDENLLCYSYHFAFPGLGHFKTDGDGFAWQPLAI